MGILREAVATHAKSRLTDVAVRRSNPDCFNDLEEIDIHRLCETAPLLNKRNIHGAIGVLEYLSRLRGGRRSKTRQRESTRINDPRQEVVAGAGGGMGVAGIDTPHVRDRAQIVRPRHDAFVRVCEK